MITDTSFHSALARVDAALTSMRSGDPEPYIACWADRPDTTLFGAWGPIEQGTEDLSRTFRWVGGRFTGGETHADHLVVEMSGDLAYTIGFERGPASVGGGPPAEMVIRVTHLYRRVDDDWKLVHRHADFPPADQRPA